MRFSKPFKRFIRLTVITTLFLREVKWLSVSCLIVQYIYFCSKPLYREVRYKLVSLFYIVYCTRATARFIASEFTLIFIVWGELYEFVCFNSTSWVLSIKVKYCINENLVILLSFLCRWKQMIFKLIYWVYQFDIWHLLIFYWVLNK